jgi:uncharacterized protein (TIGR02147 family)
MTGKRSLPKREVLRLARTLGLSPRQTQNLFKPTSNQVQLTKDANQSRQISDNELNFRILSEWEYFAVLSLIDTVDFEPSFDHVAKRLGITRLRASLVVKGLSDAGLIRMEASRWVKLDADIHTSEDVESAALQRAHIEELELARRKIETVSVALRDFSSLSFATAESKLPEIKQMIREFRQSILSFSEDDCAMNEQVYQLCIQLFPLTKSIEESDHVDSH